MTRPPGQWFPQAPPESRCAVQYHERAAGVDRRGCVGAPCTGHERRRGLSVGGRSPVEVVLCAGGAGDQARGQPSEERKWTQARAVARQPPGRRMRGLRVSPCRGPGLGCPQSPPCRQRPRSGEHWCPPGSSCGSPPRRCARPSPWKWASSCSPLSSRSAQRVVSPSASRSRRMPFTRSGTYTVSPASAALSSMPANRAGSTLRTL